ncbi:MAG: tetratricopeptide repeat protein [Nitrospirota bacterium]|nr:tetratricopeptide repeat protein [Nitrospirota bacterium]
MTIDPAETSYPDENSQKSTDSGESFFQSFLVLLSLVCVLLFSGCATTQRAEDIKEAEAHNNLGLSYLNNKQTNEAYIEFQKAVRLDPKNKETLNYLGYISAIYKKHDEAISYYKRAIAIDHEYSDAMNNLGLVYLDINNWDMAIKYFKSALNNTLYRTPENAYSSLGYAYYKKKDYLNAEKSLKEGLLRNPAFPLAMYYLGLVYIGQEKYDAAIAELHKAIAFIPDYYEAHWELASIYLILGKNSKALKHLEVVAEENNNNERRRKAQELIRSIKY